MRKLQNSHVAPWTPIRGQHLTWPQFQSWIPSKRDRPKVSWAQLRLPPNGCLKDHEVKNEDHLLRHQTIYASIIQHTFPWFVPNRFWNAYSGALVSTQEKGLTLENTWTSAAGPSCQSPSKSPFWWPPGLANRSVGWLNSRFGDLYWYGILYATWKVKTGQRYGMVWYEFMYVRTHVSYVRIADMMFIPFILFLSFWNFGHISMWIRIFVEIHTSLHWQDTLVCCFCFGHWFPECAEDLLPEIFNDGPLLGAKSTANR